MNWGFHFHILGSRAGAHQDLNGFQKTFQNSQPSVSIVPEVVVMPQVPSEDLGPTRLGLSCF